MEIFKLIVELLKILIWPIVVIYAIHKFGKQILALIPNIREMKIAGAEIKWEKKLEARIEEKIQEVTEKPKDEVEQKDQPIEIRPYPHKPDDRVMLAFATGKSWKENLDYRIYYDPVSRNNNTPFTFLGLYRDQSIKYVGKVSKIFCCDYEDGVLKPTNGNSLDMITTEEYERIKNTIETANYEIENNHKFYLVEEFYETAFIKSSAGGIMSKKYFWLDEYGNFTIGMNAQQIAAFLNGKTWE